MRRNIIFGEKFWIMTRSIDKPIFSPGEFVDWSPYIKIGKTPQGVLKNWYLDYWKKVYNIEIKIIPNHFLEVAVDELRVSPNEKVTFIESSIQYHHFQNITDNLNEYLTEFKFPEFEFLREK